LIRLGLVICLALVLALLVGGAFLSVIGLTAALQSQLQTQR
jgi:hypothetical protein